MLEKKVSCDIAYMADDHVLITTRTWVEEDGKRITDDAVGSEQIERLQKDLHAYPEIVQTLAPVMWGYLNLDSYDDARSALIAEKEAEAAQQEAANEPTP